MSSMMEVTQCSLIVQELRQQIMILQQQQCLSKSGKPWTLEKFILKCALKELTLLLMLVLVIKHA